MITVIMSLLGVLVTAAVEKVHYPGFGIAKTPYRRRKFMWAAMHCEMSGMRVCTASEFEVNTGVEKKSLCSLEMFYNNCPTTKASHSACEWKEVFPQCERRIDFSSPVVKVRGYSQGRGNKKRLSGLVVKLNDGQVRTFGAPNG